MIDRNDMQWYRDAIIYQLHVKSFFDSNNDGIGDFAGLIAEARLHAGSRRHRDLAAAVLSLAAARRRLRHRRLSRHQSRAYGTLRDFKALHRAPRMSAACGSSPNSSSTTPPTSIPGSSARAPPSPARPARNFYVWTDTDKATRTRAIIFLDTEKSNWTWDEAGQGLLLAPLLLPSAGSQFRQSARARGRARRDALLARHGRRRPAARRHPLSGRARRHEQREPARDPRDHQEASAPRSTPTIPTACCSPRPTSGRRTCALFRRRRRMPHGVSLPADAAHLHGDRAGGPPPDHRHHAPDAGDPRELPMGDLPAQPRRADARNGHRQGARLSVEASMPPTGARASISASAAASRRCWTTTAARSSC